MISMGMRIDDVCQREVPLIQRLEIVIKMLQNRIDQDRLTTHLVADEIGPTGMRIQLFEYHYLALLIVIVRDVSR